MNEIKMNLDLFKSQEELKAYTNFLKTVDDNYLKQFKNAEELNAHIDYLNSREFIDDLMSGTVKNNRN